MTISKLEKQEKLTKILDHIEKNNITAYSISQGTGLSEMGLGKIIKGLSKNPNGTTVIAIYDFLFKNKKSDKKTNITKLSNSTKLCKDGVCFNDVEVAIHVATNESDFMKIKIFENIIERNVANRILEIVKDGKLKEFLS